MLLQQYCCSSTVATVPLQQYFSGSLSPRFCREWAEGGALEFASSRLRGDRTIVREALQTDGNALQFASEDLKADRALVYQALCSGGSLEHASQEVRDDWDFLWSVVEPAYMQLAGGLFLSLAETSGEVEFRNISKENMARVWRFEYDNHNRYCITGWDGCRWGCLTANNAGEVFVCKPDCDDDNKWQKWEVKCDGETFQIWSVQDVGPGPGQPRFLSMKDGEACLVEKNGGAEWQMWKLPSNFATGYISKLSCCSETIRSDAALVKEIVVRNADFMLGSDNVTEELRNDLEVWKLVLNVEFSRGNSAFVMMVPQHIMDRELALTCLQRDGMTLMYLSDAYRGDEALVLEAMKQNPGAIEFATGDIQLKLKDIAATGRALGGVKSHGEGGGYL